MGKVFLTGGAFALYKCIIKYIDKLMISIYNCYEMEIYGYQNRQYNSI